MKEKTNVILAGPIKDLILKLKDYIESSKGYQLAGRLPGLKSALTEHEDLLPIILTDSIRTDKIDYYKENMHIDLITPISHNRTLRQLKKENPNLIGINLYTTKRGDRINDLFLRYNIYFITHLEDEEEKIDKLTEEAEKRGMHVIIATDPPLLFGKEKGNYEIKMRKYYKRIIEPDPGIKVEDPTTADLLIGIDSKDIIEDLYARSMIEKVLPFLTKKMKKKEKGHTSIEKILIKNN